MAALPTPRFKIGDFVVISNPLPICDEEKNRITKIIGIERHLWCNRFFVHYITDLGIRLDGEIREMTNKEKLNHKISELEKAEKELQKQIAALKEEVNKPEKLKDGCYITRFKTGSPNNSDRVVFVDGNAVTVFSLDGAMQLDTTLDKVDLTVNYWELVKVESIDPLRK